ncbi:MAG: hypothetical protein RR351_04970, partial [Christensenella sp.]
AVLILDFFIIGVLCCIKTSQNNGQGRNAMTAANDLRGNGEKGASPAATQSKTDPPKQEGQRQRV